MARYTGAVCRQCRREGQKLFLKGERCYSEKCSLTVRAYAPGQHGQGRKKSSDYGLHLRAKQRARRFYGVAEHQFRHYYGLLGEESRTELMEYMQYLVYKEKNTPAKKEMDQDPHRLSAAICR